MSQTITADFKLAQLVRAFFEKNEWRFEVEERETSSHLMFMSHVCVDYQTYSIFIESNEQRETVELFLYSPFRVHPSRIPELAIILNRINVAQRLGRFAIWDDGEPNAIQWKGAIDVEGSGLTVQQIDTLCSAGSWGFAHYFDLLSRVGLTSTSADSAWTSFLESLETKKTESRETEGREEVPAEL